MAENVFFFLAASFSWRDQHCAERLQPLSRLSIYRAIQGIGGGALIPIAFTIIFDIFPLEKRGKITGLFGAVFGLSSIFGPLIGAYVTDYISWHWIFYMNLPLGMVSFIFILLFYKETKQHEKHRIDWLGAITLVGAVVCLMFALEARRREIRLGFECHPYPFRKCSRLVGLLPHDRAQSQ